METEASLVGITTTIPVEVVFAAGVKPVDLNNVFVSHPARGELIERALAEGFPQNTCAWLKGIFGAVMEQGPRRVIGVVRGDCSGTGVLLEALEAWGCLLYTSDAADDLLCVDLGGRRIIKKKKKHNCTKH